MSQRYFPSLTQSKAPINAMVQFNLHDGPYTLVRDGERWALESTRCDERSTNIRPGLRQLNWPSMMACTHAMSVQNP